MGRLNSKCFDVKNEQMCILCFYRLLCCLGNVTQGKCDTTKYDMFLDNVSINCSDFKVEFRVDVMVRLYDNVYHSHRQ